MDVVVDTDILSTLLKVGKLDLLLKLFPKSKILLCPSAASEMGRSTELGFTTETLETLTKVELAPREKELAREIAERPALGLADCECLSVAKIRECLLLSNDRLVRSEASSRGIETMSLPLVLRELWRSEVLKKEDVAKLVIKIERRDNMVFKQRRLIFD